MSLTCKQIVALPITAVFFVGVVVFFGPFVAVYVVCKTLSWLASVGLGGNETWKQHVFEAQP